ncbi:hypothetical protein HDU76_012620 [Blyttiomyces sp. JEL0837]|nr:hypothetical protein HDU76_012620 [Blyttiomyces sp. JEL0837]
MQLHPLLITTLFTIPLLLNLPLSLTAVLPPSPPSPNTPIFILYTPYQTGTPATTFNISTIQFTPNYPTHITLIGGQITPQTGTFNFQYGAAYDDVFRDFVGEVRKVGGGRKAMITIGGWDSCPFSETVANATLSGEFNRSLMEVLERFGFDGIDIDWEYPSIGGYLDAGPHAKYDIENFVIWLNELRDLMEPDKIISVAVGTFFMYGPDQVTPITNATAFANVVNYFTIMLYEKYSRFAPNYTGINSPLTSYSTPDGSIAMGVGDIAIKRMVAAGIPLNKIVLGSEWYGYAINTTSSMLSNSAANQTAYTNPNISTWTATPIPYKTLSNLQQDPLNNRKYDNNTTTTWMFNNDTMTYYTYDDELSLFMKSWFARCVGLGGVSGWIADEDFEGWLVRSVARGLMGGSGGDGDVGGRPDVDGDVEGLIDWCLKRTQEMRCDGNEGLQYCVNDVTLMECSSDGFWIETDCTSAGSMSNGSMCIEEFETASCIM